jgi:membrane-associated phospholipid phosphatase
MLDKANNEAGAPVGTRGRPAAHSDALDRRAEAGLHSPGYLGQWPLLGLLLVALGLAGFAFCAFHVRTNGPMLRYDVVVANALYRVAINSPAWLRDLMVSGYYVGQHLIVAIGVLLAAYFLYHRFWPELAMVVIAWAGEGSLWLLIAPYFNRPRPAFPVPVWHHMTAPSFPSGHTIASVMCYGLLVYLIAPRVRSGWGKAAVIAIGVLLILFVGFSRLFIEDHWLTDVLAGLALGVAWASLVYTTVELVARSTQRSHGLKAE